MSKRIVIATFIFALALFAALRFPALLLNPGPLSKGHGKIAGDCFACHLPLLGPSDDKCIRCHPVEKIAAKGKPAFHQGLSSQRCVNCHTDHAEADSPTRTFDHALLPAGLPCQQCHAAPKDPLHGKLTGECSTCHGNKAWKPLARPFDHALLPAGLPCQQCHAAPKDRFHQNAQGACASCHGNKAWKPATLDHSRLFRFDRHHPDKCDSCHPDNVYSRYTCYDCHEHSPAKIRGEHLEEGIRNFDKCTECHRSGDEDEAKRNWRNGAGGSLNNGEQRWMRNDDDEHRGRRHRDDD